MKDYKKKKKATTEYTKPNNYSSPSNRGKCTSVGDWKNPQRQ